MLGETGIGEKFWSSATRKGRKVHNLRTFGAVLQITKECTKKLDANSWERFFVGYVLVATGYGT